MNLRIILDGIPYLPYHPEIREKPLSAAFRRKQKERRKKALTALLSKGYEAD